MYGVTAVLVSEVLYDRSCVEWVTGSKIEDNRIRFQDTQ